MLIYEPAALPEYPKDEQPTSITQAANALDDLPVYPVDSSEEEHVGDLEVTQPSVQQKQLP